MVAVLVIAHPETGVVIEDTLDALLDEHETIDRRLRSLSPLYHFRDQLLARIGELRGPVSLPRASRRTETQKRVSACPACGRREIDGP